MSLPNNSNRSFKCWGRNLLMHRIAVIASKIFCHCFVKK